jgi:hypothetical protein
MERLSAPERTREELRALMNGELGTAADRSDLVRLALRLIVEEALEGEVANVLASNPSSITSTTRSQAPQDVGQAGPERPGGGSEAALSRALPGLHGQALPQASHQGPRLRLGLHLDEAASAVERRCSESAAQERPPAQARAPSAAGDDAASGRLAPPMARGPSARPHLSRWMTRAARSTRPFSSRRKAPPRASGR